MSNYHVPIMLNEVLSYLRLQQGGIFTDGTLGGGGHSAAIFNAMPAGSALYCIDRDADAVLAGRERLTVEAGKPENAGKTFHIIRGNFFNMKELLANAGVTAVMGILLDLGVSSHQLDEPARGFSFMSDAPLDMRMDTSAALSAADVVNTYSEERLRQILYDYGEERYAPRIARQIVSTRANKPIETTLELADIVKHAMPAAGKREAQHPAKRTFQAIRIEVNSELNGLADALTATVDMLAPGGRLAVITFHSLEDRIAKQTFLTLQDPCTCDKRAPMCVCGKKPVVRVITRKPVTPSEDELLSNSRSHSAKLRVCEKL